MQSHRTQDKVCDFITALKKTFKTQTSWKNGDLVPEERGVFIDERKSEES
jgi:hypothetical protein